MRKNLLIKRSFVFLLFFPIILCFSCGGKTTTRPTKPKFKFTINGVVVKDLSLGKDIAFFTILRDSVTFDSAIVKVGGYTLNNEGGGEYSKEASQLFNFGQNVSITISCSKDSFSLATSRLIPSYFYIDDLPLDGDTLNPGGHSVNVSWSPSIYASGYFISMVKPDTTPGVVGYTKLDDLNDRSEAILTEGFRTSQGTLVYGRYEVYVIAYYKSFLEYPGMSFEIPQGLPMNNLDGANGTIGTGVVGEKKYIRVVTSQ
jgi:hypothetical protein